MYSSRSPFGTVVAVDSILPLASRPRECKYIGELCLTTFAHFTCIFFSSLLEVADGLQSLRMYPAIQKGDTLLLPGFELQVQCLVHQVFTWTRTTHRSFLMASVALLLEHAIIEP